MQVELRKKTKSSKTTLHKIEKIKREKLNVFVKEIVEM